jgi:hypothetical protein
MFPVIQITLEGKEVSALSAIRFSSADLFSLEEIADIIQPATLLIRERFPPRCIYERYFCEEEQTNIRFTLRRERKGPALP